MGSAGYLLNEGLVQLTRSSRDFRAGNRRGRKSLVYRFILRLLLDRSRCESGTGSGRYRSESHVKCGRLVLRDRRAFKQAVLARASSRFLKTSSIPEIAYLAQ